MQNEFTLLFPTAKCFFKVHPLLFVSSSGASIESIATLLYGFLRSTAQWMAYLTREVQNFGLGRGCLCSLGSSHLSLRTEGTGWLLEKAVFCNRGEGCLVDVTSCNMRLVKSDIYDVWIWTLTHIAKLKERVASFWESLWLWINTCHWVPNSFFFRENSWGGVSLTSN